MSAESKMVEYAASYRQVTSKLNDRPVSLNAVKRLLKMRGMENYMIWQEVERLPSVAPSNDGDSECIYCKHCFEGSEFENATPERPKGHWIEERNDYGEIQGWHCDKCYEDSGFTTKCKWDFCPNCGADMRGDNT